MKVLARFAVPLIVTALLGLSVALAVTLKNSQEEDVRGKIGLDQKLGNRLPLDATFRDEEGKSVKLGEFFHGKPVVMMLVFYTCQGSCQLEFENATTSFSDMKLKNIGRDFEVVSLSIHPKETSKLAAMKKEDILDHYTRPGARQGWHFLTGDETEIRKVASAIGFRYSYDPVKDRLLHPTGLFVLTPDARLSRYLYGIDYASPLLADSIDLAASGTIGAPSEPILFGCFQYDPKTGRTRLNVMRATQIAGIATLAILALSLLSMSLRHPSGPHLKSKEELIRLGD